MKRSQHIITFLARLKKFTQEEGITSMLIVDAENTIEDVFENAEMAGGLIAEIDNGVGEIIDILYDYYDQTGNKKLLKRLEKLNGKTTPAKTQ